MAPGVAGRRRIGRRGRVLFRALLSVVLGTGVTLALCLAFSFWSTVLSRIDWENVVQRGDSPMHVWGGSTFGKSMVSWDVLTEEQVATLDRADVSDGGVRRGDRAPPAWSSYWDDAAYREVVERTRAGGVDRRRDVAVGWPLRAFVGTYRWDREAKPPRFVWRDAVELPKLWGEANPVIEDRAIPLRVYWPGLLANVCSWSVLVFTVLSVVVSWFSAAADLGTAATRRIRLRVTLRRSLAAGLAGVALAVLTGIVLPACAPPWYTECWSVERPYVSGANSILWSRRTTRDSALVMDAITPATARAFDEELRRGRMTWDRQLRKLGPRDEIDGGGPCYFQSTRTGFPFRMLWGERWTSSSGSQTVNMVDMASLRDRAPRVVRGLQWMPTGPRVLGWIGNIAVYAAASLVVLSELDLWRQAGRRRRGCCPCCGFSLRGTPEHLPCPECGDAVASERRAGASS